jgi:hypothetical protein
MYIYNMMMIISNEKKFRFSFISQRLITQLFSHIIFISLIFAESHRHHQTEIFMSTLS